MDAVWATVIHGMMLMCCNTRVDVRLPRDEIASILLIAGFHATQHPPLFIREFEPMQTERRWMDGTPITENRLVRATIQPYGVSFSLSPSIASHTEEQHALNALGAAIMFKTVMTLAERGGGSARQLLLMADCLRENSSDSRLLADYSIEPPIQLDFANLCLGFRTVLLQGIGDATRGAFDGEYHSEPEAPPA